MGYTSGWTSKTELVEELLHAPSGVLKVIDHALVGNHLWTVRQFTEDTDRFKKGFRFVQLYLLSSYQGSWGYKGLCESDHPFYYDCPERLLAASDDEGEAATRWRAACRADREERAARLLFLRSLTHGAPVVIDGTRPAKYLGPIPGQTRSVAVELDGRRYRVAKSRMTAPAPKVAAA